MNLKDWQDNGWLKQHTTDKQEIANLLSIVERDLNDAGNTTVSSDWRFGIAYNAALKLCTIVLYAQGYRPENTLAHYRTGVKSHQSYKMDESFCILKRLQNAP